jgi:hypothetical protein
VTGREPWEIHSLGSHRLASPETTAHAVNGTTKTEKQQRQTETGRDRHRQRQTETETDRSGARGVAVIPLDLKSTGHGLDPHRDTRKDFNGAKARLDSNRASTPEFNASLPVPETVSRDANGKKRKRDRQRQTERQRQAESRGRDSQRQTETDRDRQTNRIPP